MTENEVHYPPYPARVPLERAVAEALDRALELVPEGELLGSGDKPGRIDQAAKFHIQAFARELARRGLVPIGHTPEEVLAEVTDENGTPVLHDPLVLTAFEALDIYYENFGRLVTLFRMTRDHWWPEAPPGLKLIRPPSEPLP